MTVQNPARERGSEEARLREGEQRRGDLHHVTRPAGGGDIKIWNPDIDKPEAKSQSKVQAPNT